MTKAIAGGRYELQAVVGEGGMGTVYRGVDVKMQREVIVKMLSNQLLHSENARSRFRSEGIIQGRVAHPHIVRVTDVVEEPETLALVMDPAGIPFDQWIQECGPGVAFDRIWSVLKPVMDAIQCAHEAGVVHRDLKPGNILVASGRGSDIARVADFGIAKIVAESGSGRTRLGTVMGTPAYMPPEQLRGELTIDNQVDVYAMAVVIYQTFTGRVPYGFGEDVPRNMVQHPVPTPMADLVGGLPSGFDAVIARGMALERERRYTSMAAFAADIDAVAAGTALGFWGSLRQ